ncbi:2-amino-4-hydroxy-6-hydroxymethyldihydropteridine diphosphokinase [Virgibacillus profundi]|uniref:2-amino-4-hydroxy-6-hydroxymethyldihydropteridine diphosphokinase n=1 Tax=Virgibacillus profundi TaxID=2024555 RepID=A0A2A2IAC3_9BACI|nr:2-amino-4-hydroxy-6-hydroxymethyldihydropteridine diphosphokinase [Virgibacillus profundi]PAV28587.1 2-amino-4-hydroxy-6-hydroxymethyldihydropteridine diphosphokinase [Virgibacillus profundi]PXY51770.1 2-amino-4-hydroxy-6-hydroxymethyldihydropteridine diphosphokinase [Virgibacillus profundi]
MNKAYVALGTNIEPRIEYLNSAIASLDKNNDIAIQNKSSIYETAPVGYADQADFLNMVVGLDTSLSSIELLDICQEIEKQLGRKRGIRFGPRTIDLDILMYNYENSKMERLIIPHPRMQKRAFVLIPLNEIAPNLIIPSTDEPVVDLMNKLPESDKKDVTKWTQSGLAEE